MKHMRKAAGFILVLIMALSMSMTAFAANDGSITINGAKDGNVYEIYKIFDLKSFNAEGKYSYKLQDARWENFFATGAEGADYIALDDQKHVTWIADTDDETKATFAKLALAYAEEKGITPVRSSSNPGDYVDASTATTSAIKFTDLELGYYLIDSTMGALCGLTTTNKDASITAKNSSPTIDKQVQEDSTNNWGENNTADIGQTVNFRVTINVHAGAQNYVLHDEMSAGLTFDPANVKVEHVIPGQDTHVATSDKYTVVTTGLTDDCTFEIRFTKEFCDSLETNDKVVVSYSAMLNSNAVVGALSDGTGNSNETKLDYGENHHTTSDTTQTYTYGFDLIKTDGVNNLIDGAEFKIYDAATGGNEIAVVLMGDNETYRRAGTDETGVNIVVKDGKVRVVGFDNGVYYLEEVVTPAGYNQLGARQRFIISDGNLDATFNGGSYSTGSGVHVVNKSGTMLPETGGMGTVIFVSAGMFVALATGVLLVTKKRMSMIED